MNPEIVVVDLNEIDINDVAYVALALELNGRLWTGDKPLKAGLIAKGFDRFFEP